MHSNTLQGGRGEGRRGGWKGGEGKERKQSIHFLVPELCVPLVGGAYRFLSSDNVHG